MQIGLEINHLRPSSIATFADTCMVKNGQNLVKISALGFLTP